MNDNKNNISTLSDDLKKVDMLLTLIHGATYPTSKVKLESIQKVITEALELLSKWV